MSFAPETEFATDTLAKPEALLRVPMGLASPLWGFFAGAAVSGAAWWWMTRWARAENLEALFGGAQALVAPEPATFAAPVLEAPEAAETVIEAVAEPVLEALAEAEPALEAVGGESAPISPVVEALAPEIAEPAAESAGTAKAKKKAGSPPTSDLAD